MHPSADRLAQIRSERPGGCWRNQSRGIRHCFYLCGDELPERVTSSVWERRRVKSSVDFQKDLFCLLAYVLKDGSSLNYNVTFSTPKDKNSTAKVRIIW